jgi:hypothetical protein
MNQKAYGVARFAPILSFITIAFGLSAAACTGDDSSDRTITPPAVPTTEKYVVSDFELPAMPGICSKATSSICYANVGAWYPYDDGSIVVPGDAGGLPESGPPPGLEILELAPRDALVTYDAAKPSTTAMRIYGGPYTGSYGSGLSHSFIDGGVMSIVDYSGIVFWAKRGSAGTTVMHLTMTTLDDTGKGQLPDGSAPICDDSAPAAKNVRCSDGFGVDVVLHEEWLPYVVYFSDLKQQGYGYKPPGGFHKSNATGINIGNKQGVAFDEYIDDIALFK